MRVDRESGVVRETSVVDLFGNRTTIAFDELRENTKPGADLFALHAARGRARDRCAEPSLSRCLRAIPAGLCPRTAIRVTPRRPSRKRCAERSRGRRSADGRVKIAARLAARASRGGRLNASCAGLAPIGEASAREESVRRRARAPRRWMTPSELRKRRASSRTRGAPVASAGEREHVSSLDTSRCSDMFEAARKCRKH